jgi:hypothetical protein
LSGFAWSGGEVGKLGEVGKKGKKGEIGKVGENGVSEGGDLRRVVLP